MSIKTRLIIIFLTLAIIPAFFLSTLIFHNSIEYIRKIALADLNLVVEGKEAEIREFIEAKRGRVVDYTTDGYIRSAMERINSLKRGTGRRGTGEELSEYLTSIKLPVDQDLIEIHILDPAGEVVASTDMEFIGHDDSGKKYFAEGLKHPFVQGVDTHTHGGVEHQYIPVAAPIKKNGRTIGVLMNGYSIDLARKLLSGERSTELGSPTGMGLESLESIDFFLVSGEGYLFTPMKKARGYKPFTRRINTLPVRKCLEEGVNVNTEWRDILGNHVWGASHCVRIKNGPLWTLVAEQDREQALKPVEDLKYVFYVVGFGLMVVVGLTAWAVALSISRPIERLRRGTEILARGELDHRVGTDSPDEIGALSRAFDSMTRTIRMTTASIDELEKEAAERINAEEALRESENKYRNFVDNSLVGIYSTTIGGRILFANRALAAMFEYESAEDMMSRDIISIYKKSEDREALLERLRTGQNVEDFEAEFITKTGEVKNVLLSATLSGDVITGMIVDITELKKAKEIRREAEHIRAQADVSAALANAALDFQGVVETVTRYVAEHTGDWSVLRLLSEDKKWLNPAAVYHRSPALLQALMDLVSTNPLRADAGPGGELARSGKPLLLDTPDKVYTLVGEGQREELDRIGAYSVFMAPLRAYGKVIGTLGVGRFSPDRPFTEDDRLFVQDIADKASLAISNARLFNEVQQELLLRKSAEEVTRRYAAALERSNADLQQFAYVASHDLQEPLRMITSYLHLLRRRYGGKLGEDADKFIDSSMEGAVRMERMITDLLGYSRVQSQERAHEEVDCEELFKQILSNLRVSIAESNAVITRDRLPVVMGDSSLLMHVVQNLLSNAIKFRSEVPPRIHVSAKEKQDEWVFSVRDNGIGINEKYKDKLFIIFQRVDEKKYPGTGIGLAVCKRIIERHGGRIWFESEEGKGSTFYFTLPRERHAEGETKPGGR